ncbi:hypothetical protein BIU82_13925 [Arthrobacter sp. SW1]|uniref:hypothetical protein n=1 Tax=Arthrobacter sp. SW1 TaxID=1920889 RepID=UPI000877CDC7|nr:hypothetical protein [Arthrobacter sp. SW1]OFI39425.1 hypothetical protein BIU82_13925 [Arthrobacter sp. SW1]
MANILAEIRSKRIEIALTLVGLVVGSLWIPSAIDSNAAGRQRQSDCFRAVLDLRRSAEQLDRGYAIHPELRQERLADLDSVNLNLKATDFSCQNVEEHRELRTELATISNNFGEVRRNASVGIETPEYARGILSWTDRRMQAK